MFSIETPAERKSHLGLNITDMYQDEEVCSELTHNSSSGVY